MEKPSGVRETKRRDTHERIAAAAMTLFLERGFEETTLDAIAEAAGISRRTFFYYFASKDDILLSWDQADSVPEALRVALLHESPPSNPLTVASECLITVATRFEKPESRAIDALMRSSDSLRSRKDAVFVSLEAHLTDALATVWPDDNQRSTLRAAAMIATGVLRLAREDWLTEDSGRPLADYLRDGFDAVRQATLGSIDLSIAPDSADPRQTSK